MSVANATPHAVLGTAAPAVSRSRIRLRHLGVGGCLAMASSLPATAQSPPDLGTAAPFAVLGTNVVATSGTVTCTDTGPGTAINGDVGTTFNTITNNGCTITGAV